MSEKLVRIGGAAGFFADSALSVPQLLAAGVDYLVFDALAESVMGGLARQMRADPEGGWVKRFLDAQIGPHLREISRTGTKVISNAGGLNPRACAEAIRRRVAEEGLALTVAAVEGDNLTPHLVDFASLGFKDMYTGRPLAEMQEAADEALSFTAYTGAFPIAQALGLGADIVVTGRAVDTAPTLGALIHAFGWGPDDFDQLAGGMVAGHLLECGTAAVGGTFTDWRDVPGWADMGYPIAECRADGSLVITKPAGTGGLVSVGSVSEQILYEVSDIGAYFAPDVVCDWTDLRIEPAGADRVRLSGARGLSRTGTYKACLTYDDGWRAAFAYPVLGVEAAAKAERLAQAMLQRSCDLLRQRNLGEWRRTCVEVIGAEASYGSHAASQRRGAREVICRVAVDHEAREAVQLFAEEASPFIAHVVGASMPLQASVGPVQQLGSFLIDKALVPLTISFGDNRRPAVVPTQGDYEPSITPHKIPPAPATDASPTVPLIALAWVRSGDKGDLFNVSVIARKAAFLPYLAQALTPAAVARWYAHVFNPGAAAKVERQYAPGFHALNLILHEAVGGGLSSNLKFDGPGKGIGQQLLDFPVPVSPAIAAEVGDVAADLEAARPFEGVI
jgi:hypothetical protein